MGSTVTTVAVDEGLERKLSLVVTRPTTPGPSPDGGVGVRVDVRVGVDVAGVIVPVGVFVGVGVAKSTPKLSTGSPDLPPETPAAACERTALPSSQLRAWLTDAPGLAA